MTQQGCYRGNRIAPPRVALLIGFAECPLNQEGRIRWSSCCRPRLPFIPSPGQGKRAQISTRGGCGHTVSPKRAATAGFQHNHVPCPVMHRLWSSYTHGRRRLTHSDTAFGSVSAIITRGWHPVEERLKCGPSTTSSSHRRSRRASATAVPHWPTPMVTVAIRPREGKLLIVRS